MDYSTLVEKLLMACLRFLSTPRSWITTKDGPFKPEEGIPTVGMPLRQRARSCETPSSSRPIVGPRRSPSSSSDAPRSKIVAGVRCSRTSEPIRLSHAV
jgi:hypothetical protein